LGIGPHSSVVFDLVSTVLAKRLAEKNVSEITYFVLNVM